MSRVRFDRHHINHGRLEHELRPESRMIRETPSLVPLMDRGIHTELHKHCPTVPVLGYHALMLVARDYNPTDDTFESIDNLMLAIESAAKHPRAHELERRMADIVVESLELQRPFIRAGIVLPADKQTRRIVA